MAITFDPTKIARNIVDRGLSFERIAEMDWNAVLMTEDNRRDYGEIRIRVFGLLDDRLHVALVTPRGADLRAVGLRKEERLYDEETTRRGRTPR